MTWTTIPELLEDLRADKNSAVWNRFVEKYRPLLLGYVRHMNLSEAEAEDVVHNVLLTLLRAMPRFEYDRQRGRFRTWLYTVVRNELRNSRRRQARRKRAEEEHRNLAEMDQDETEPDALWNETYREKILETALEQIKAQTSAQSWYCFEQFVLKQRQGGEVAGEVGLQPNSVRVNAYRVFEKVRALCAAYLAKEEA